MGLGSVAGISSLSNLQDVTLTMAEGLGATGWRELGRLTSLTSLNINAWTDVVRGGGGMSCSTRGMSIQAKSCSVNTYIHSLPLELLPRP